MTVQRPRFGRADFEEEEVQKPQDTLRRIVLVDRLRPGASSLLADHQSRSYRQGSNSHARGGSWSIYPCVPVPCHRTRLQSLPAPFDLPRHILLGNHHSMITRLHVSVCAFLLFSLQTLRLVAPDLDSPSILVCLFERALNCREG